VSDARAAVRRVAVLGVAAAFLLLPFFLLTGSLRLPGQPPPNGLELLPSVRWWGNYELARTLVGAWPAALRNSLLVAAVAVPVTVLIGSLAGFALATGSRGWRRLLAAATLVALAVPASALWVPRFWLFRVSGLHDTLAAVASPALLATSPFYVLVFALAFSRVPRSLYEAAGLAGLSPLRTWWQVGVPLTRPAAFAVTVLAFTAHWSNLVEPLLYTSSAERATLPLLLRQLQMMEPSNHPVLLAGAVMVTAPAVLLFLLAQRAFLVRIVDTAGEQP
jgi:multiple sugar transport system permease protein